MTTPTDEKTARAITMRSFLRKQRGIKKKYWLCNIAIKTIVTVKNNEPNRTEYFIDLTHSHWTNFGPDLIESI